MTLDPQLAAGARNLLINCAGVPSGSRLLIVREDPSLAWYDEEAPRAVEYLAGELGIDVNTVEVGPPENSRDPEVVDAIDAHDCTIFFARIGDQDRFADPPDGKTLVMSYVRDADMLASAYGTADHRAFLDLKEAINDVVLGAKHIEITCPLGTRITGAVSELDKRERRDVGVRRFPLGVPQPVSATTFSGRVALARYLTPTGSNVYEPPSIAISSPVIAEVKAGRIGNFAGEADDVRQIRAHYDAVSAQFGIDGSVVHSWHAGIHPGCAYRASAEDDPDRWSNTAFTNPRILHFHTCGDYAPGEICWMIVDHTVKVDGVPLWEDGRLRPENFARTEGCFDTWPELRTLFARPAREIGIDA